MGWRDWIEPRDVSQQSQESLSQDSETSDLVSQQSQLSASQIEKKSCFDPEKDGSEKFATVTVATPATVRCTDCRHFTPDSINPADGIGSCNADLDGLHYPRMKRDCNGFQISRPSLDQLACEVSTDPETFAAGVWADGIYIHPTHIRRLAQLVNERGIFSDWSKSS